MSNKISNFILNADVALTQFDSFTLEETTSNELKCSGNKLIKCTITCTLPNDIHISRVMLKLRKITGTRLSFYIANIIGNLIEDPGFVQEAGVSDIEDPDYQYIDITSFVSNQTSNTHTFVIKPANPSSSFICTQTCQVILNGIKNEYHITDKPLMTKDIGYINKCIIDPIFRTFKVVTNLISCQGGDLPLNLNIVYDHYNTNDRNIISPNFKFNYEQYVIQDGVNYKYIDGQSNIHIFKPTNIVDTYYDIAEPGTLLIVSDTSYRITDEHKKNLYFNSEGQLTKISIKKTDTVSSECNIEYENNKISEIIDDYGRSCSFVHYGETETSPRMIVINKIGMTSKTIYFSNGLISDISGIIFNGIPGNLMYYTYETIDDKVLLKTIKDPSLDVLEFTYIEKKMLSEVKHYVENETTQNLISKQKILSYHKQAYIENYDPSNTLSTKTIIEVDDEGNTIKSYEIIDNEVSNLKTINKTLYRENTSLKFTAYEIESKFDTQTNVLRSFNYMTEEVGYYESSILENINTIDDIEFQTYRINFALNINEIYSIHNNGQNIIFEVLMRDGTQEETILSKKIILYVGHKGYEYTFELPKKESIDICFRYRFEKISFSGYFYNIYFDKKYYIGTYDCIDKRTSEKVHEHTSGNWYELCAPLYIEYNDSSTDTNPKRLVDVEMTKQDYLCTLNSYYNNKTSDNHYTLWYNNGRNCLVNISNVKISLYNNNEFTFPNFYLATIKEYNDKSIVNILEIGPDGYTTHTYDDNYDDDNDDDNELITLESYDKYGKLINKYDSQNKKVSYTYNISPNGETVISSLSSVYFGDDSISQSIDKIDTITQYNDKTEYVSYVFPYPENDDNNTICKYTYTDKQKGQIVKEILPNNQHIDYTYKEDGRSIYTISSTIDNKENTNTHIYSSNKLTGLTHNNSTYEYSYGTRNELTNVSVGNYNIVTNTYAYSNKTTTINTTYNTGYVESKTYDLQGRLKEIKNNNIIKYYAIYSKQNTNDVKNSNLTTENFPESLLRKTYDGNTTTYYHYDSTNYNLDNPEVKVNDNGHKLLTKIENTDYTKKIGYDTRRRPQTITTKIDDYTNKLICSYITGDKYNDDVLDEVNIQFKTNNITKKYIYDRLNRLSNINYQKENKTLSKTVSYFTGNNYTSYNIKNINYKIDNNILNTETLKYDSLGNITEILYNDGKKLNYSYDKIGRLIREDNQVIGKSYTYIYDEGGNITSKKEYNYSIQTLNEENKINEVTFEYDTNYKDKLIKVNNVDITYGTTRDTILPIQYGNKEFEWSLNNKLTSYKKMAHAEPITFTYNALGQIIQKEQVIDINVKEVVEYIYDGDKLLREKSTIQAINPRDITPTYSSLPIVETINFIYDENSLIGFIYDGNTYYYVKDILGNIKYILDNSYNIVGKYEYDAWGNHQSYEYTSSGYVLNNAIGHILYVNPFRYKGYYYDVETQLFYCNSRYYSPELCRFIQPADVSSLNPQSINGLNLYTYALNNPIIIKYDNFNGRIVSALNSNISTQIGSSQGNTSSSGSSFLPGLYGGINSMFNIPDALMSYGGGVLDGLLSLLGSPRFDNFQTKLSTVSKWMAGIGVGLDIISSAINNYNNDNLTTGQKWASFGADAGYYVVKGGLSYAAGSLLTSGAVALGTAAGCAAITYLGAGFLGASLIAGGIVAVAIVGGTILITVLSDALDNWWEKKKEEWFN